MIKINTQPTRDELMEVLENNHGLIDLDTTAIKCGYCENLKYLTLEAFTSGKRKGKIFNIKNLHSKEGTALRIAAETSSKNDTYNGYITSICWNQEGMAFLDTNNSTIYVIGLDDESWFVHTFKKVRNIDLYNIAVMPEYVKDCEYIILANDNDKETLRRYL